MTFDGGAQYCRAWAEGYSPEHAGFKREGVFRWRRQRSERLSKLSYVDLSDIHAGLAPPWQPEQ
jgi:hypothetical protein